MANWTPNNSEAANSGSLQVWFDANNTDGYVTESSTTTDDDYGAAKNISRIYNLGTTGHYLERQASGYPTLRTGSLSGKNGFKFGNKAGSWGPTIMQSNNSGISTITSNSNRLVLGVMSNIFVDARGGLYKGLWGTGDFSNFKAFSLFVDTNGDIDTPIMGFGITLDAATTNNLIADPSPGNKAIISMENKSSNAQNLFFNTANVKSATRTLNTSISSNAAGFKLGSSEYVNDSSDYVLHELLVYSVADSGTGADGFRNTVEGYLAHKWGITDLLPSDHPYKSAAPQIGAEPPTFGNDEGEKLNVNPEGAPDGPSINRFSAVNTNYGKSGGVEQVPFTLQQPGSFSLKRRATAYQVTRGDSNE